MNQRTYEFNRLSIDEFASHAIRQVLPEQTIFQTPGWLSFLIATQKGEPLLLLISEHGRPVGYFTGMIVRRMSFRILGSPFPGWSTGYMGFNLLDGMSRGALLRDLARFAFRELGCVHVELMDRSLSGSDLDGGGWQFIEKRGFEIDLECGEQELFRRMTHQCQTNIRKALKSKVIVEEARDTGFADEYYDQLLDVFGKCGLIPTYPRTRVQELVRLFAGQPGVALLRARDAGGTCIATTIMLGHRNSAYLWGAASYRHSQCMRPNELLYWTAICRARDMGMKHFDMGGGGDYKKKYGGKPICVPWVRASRNPMFARLREVAATAAGRKLQILATLQPRPALQRIADDKADKAAA